jgi:hypothetical protein
VLCHCYLEAAAFALQLRCLLLLCSAALCSTVLLLLCSAVWLLRNCCAVLF